MQFVEKYNHCNKPDNNITSTQRLRQDVTALLSTNNPHRMNSDLIVCGPESDCNRRPRPIEI